ncbi:IMP dehydrogenase [Candidatus Bathyarchaeota archaeon]|nr:MAG: IMP dehydrogenase [Candidatus Bathyarchaeota archaeon]
MPGRFTDRILRAPVAFTFRDLILLPGLAEVEPGEVDVSTRVSVHHRLNIPFVSSPMDTVTEAEMAIALARQGGLGVLHRNCSIEEEVEMAKRVKRAESFVIRDVVTVRPDQTVGEAISIMREHDISGLPVVDHDGRLVGIVTARDVRFADPGLRVSDVMTGSDHLVKVEEGITIEEAKKILQEHRIEKLPVVDEGGRLKGLITVKDIMLRDKFPNAVRDEEGRLLCAAAISPFDLERALKLDKYVDILVVDVAHFHNRNCMEATKKIMAEVGADVVVGNIGTYQATVDVITGLEDVAGLRAGIGSGSICVTMELLKAGSPTLFATAQVADALAEYGALGHIPIIADGGVRSPGDAALALALGASCVMMGNVFAGCKEAPGEVVAIGGRYFKRYRGMASPSARARRHAVDRYFSKRIAEGVEGLVPYRGDVASVVAEFVEGLKAAMGYAGAKNIRELWEKARVAMLTEVGVKEAGPHSILLPSQEPLRSW